MECPITPLNDSRDYYSTQRPELAQITEQYYHITDAMKKLHWLPVESRIQYKVFVLMHACVHNVAPPYLSNLLTSYVPSREMRSSGQLILHQPISNMVTYGQRSFTYGAPLLWITLHFLNTDIVFVPSCRYFCLQPWYFWQKYPTNCTQFVS